MTIKEIGVRKSLAFPRPPSASGVVAATVLLALTNVMMQLGSPWSPKIAHAQSNDLPPADQIPSEQQPAWSWTIAPENIRGRHWLPSTGPLTATIEFEPTLFAGVALECDGRRQAAVAANDIAAADLPTKAVTLEARVAIRRPTPWGGFVSAFQDNGNFERGMMLGYRDSKFCLGIATKTTEKLTYLTAPNDFELNRWYHVVGTFDGQMMRLYVDGKLVAKSTEQKGNIWLPPSGVVALGAYRDDNEFIRLQGMLHEIAIHDVPLSPEEVQKRYELANELPMPPSDADERKLPEVFGPFVTSVDTQTWAVEWQTVHPCNGFVEIGPSKYSLQRVSEPSDDASQKHRVIIRDLPRDRVHQFRVGGNDENGQEYKTAIYPLDTMLHYPPPMSAHGVSHQAADRYASLAELALAKGGATRGYAFIIDGLGDLAIELAKRSSLQIIVVQPDKSAAKIARDKLHAANLYGVRVAVHERPFDDLGFGPFVANYVISDPVRWDHTKTRIKFASLFGIVKPAGGTMLLGSADQTSWSETTATRWSNDQLGINDQTDWQSSDLGDLYHVTRGKLPGASEWTHQYGQANNTSWSKDDLIRGDLSVLWWGRPGPRPMPDRGPRNPAPVSANGRLYIQGNRTLFGLDSYNGSILWFHQIPKMRRANIPRDGSNMVATDDFLYLAMQGKCVAFNGQTGDRDMIFSIPGDKPGNDRRFDWGILACNSDVLLGSAVRRGAHYIGDHGEWFEDSGPDNVSRVVSKKLFGLDRHHGALLWEYERGAIVNSTFCSENQSIYFLEGRNSAATTSTKGRLHDELKPDQYLVAINVQSGSLLWEEPVDLSHLEFMTYMSVSEDTLIIAGTDKKKVFHTIAHSSVNGSPQWKHATETRKTHHSGHLSHPLVLGDRIYANKHTFDRRTGKVLHENKDFDWHGCGVTSASNHTIFRRYEYHGMMDVETKQRTEFLGVRSGCWLSIIPSGGTVLAPETSAGCSCTHAVQTSLAYVPRYLLPAQSSPPVDQN